jgi:CHASE3 domain sensor protein
LIKDNPIQIVKLDSLKRLIKASSLEIITVREQAGLSAAIKYFNTEGKRIMDDIRKVSYNMDQLEKIH